MAVGSLVAAAGLLGFSLAPRGWQVLAVWWLVLGSAIAMTFYEPADVAIQHAFAPRSRARAIGALTLTAGFSGPIFTPGTAALVDVLGWPDAIRLFAFVLVACAPIAALLIRATPPDTARRSPRDALGGATRAPRPRPTRAVHARVDPGLRRPRGRRCPSRRALRGGGVSRDGVGGGRRAADPLRSLRSARPGPPPTCHRRVRRRPARAGRFQRADGQRASPSGRWRCPSCSSASSSAPRSRCARSSWASGSQRRSSVR
jgi:Major Facilitator Superfamily